MHTARTTLEDEQIPTSLSTANVHTDHPDHETSNTDDGNPGKELGHQPKSLTPGTQAVQQHTADALADTVGGHAHGDATLPSATPSHQQKVEPSPNQTVQVGGSATHDDQPTPHPSPEHVAVNIDSFRQEKMNLIKTMFGLPSDYDIVSLYPFAEHKKEFWTAIKQESPSLVNKFLSLFSKTKKAPNELCDMLITCAYLIQQAQDTEVIHSAIQGFAQQYNDLKASFNSAKREKILAKTLPGGVDALQQFTQMGK